MEDQFLERTYVREETMCSSISVLVNLVPLFNEQSIVNPLISLVCYIESLLPPLPLSAVNQSSSIVSNQDIKNSKCHDYLNCFIMI